MNTKNIILIGAIPLCCSTNKNIGQSKHNNIFNNVKFLHVSVYCGTGHVMSMH